MCERATTCLGYAITCASNESQMFGCWLFRFGNCLGDFLLLNAPMPQSWYIALRCRWGMKRKYTFVFLVLLIAGLPLSTSGEALPGVGFDEAKVVSCQSSVLISSELLQAAALASRVIRQRALQFQATSPFWVAVIRANAACTYRSAETPVQLALLCTLLC